MLLILSNNKDTPREGTAALALGNIVVTASKSETQGLTIIEAMASGLPVVAIEDESFSNKCFQFALPARLAVHGLAVNVRHAPLPSLLRTIATPSSNVAAASAPGRPRWLAARPRAQGSDGTSLGYFV